MKWFSFGRKKTLEQEAEAVQVKVPEQRKVLVVEDDRTLAKIYSLALEKGGFRVAVASDGQKALDFILDEPPDIILLDLQLPKMDGIQVLRQLRAQPVFKTLPVVVFTNAFLGEMTDKAIAAGATMILQKSTCTPSSVKNALTKCLAGDFEKPVKTALSEREKPTAAIPFPEGRQVLDAMKEAEHDLWFHVRRQFLDNAPAELDELRKLLNDLPGHEGSPAVHKIFRDLHARARTISGSASMAGFRNLAQFTGAFEALLKTVCEDEDEVTPSVLGTLIEATDCLSALFRTAQPSDTQSSSEIRILVVDDDTISQRLIRGALNRAGWDATLASLPSEALDILARETFDVIMLDVMMPEMNGFELCQNLRTIPEHEKTPVVFVTGTADYANRSKSIAVGGADLIAKPFLPVELAVKVLNSLLRSRIPAGST